MSNIPDFPVLKNMAEMKLTQRLGGECIIKLVTGYAEEILDTIWRIDQVKFREELRYSKNEISERMRKNGFTCVLVYLDGEPIAFEYGYESSIGVFFSDSQATLVEGKGVATTQFALEILYLYYNGYTGVTLSTEELDEQGRALRSFWERMGFKKLNEDSEGNVDMMLLLTSEVAQRQYERYIKPN